MEQKKKRYSQRVDSITKTPELKKATVNESRASTPKYREISKERSSVSPGPSCSVARSSPRRRSVSSTPESLTQRELKKLEDYWTRNDPVKEDSPRLRSNRKIIFNLKECLELSNRRSPKVDNLPQKCDKQEHSSLPESPIPGRQHPTKETNSDAAGAVSVSEKKRTKISKLPSVSTYNEKSKSCDSGGNKAIYKIEETQNLIEHELSEESSDSDDDDYIPPRKKLRSEVSKDELWDGIPLTVSFKRLAPISKSSSDKAAEFSEIKNTNHNDIEGKLLLDQETLQDNTVCKKETEINAVTEKTQSVKNTELKRSRRLRDKINRTPRKKDDISNTTTVPDKSLDRDTDENCKSDQHSPSVSSDSKEMVNVSKAETNLCSTRLVQSSILSDNLLKLTLSQILSVESRSDNVIIEDEKEDQHNGEEKEEDIKDNELTNSQTSAVVSISQTINDIFDTIGEPVELPQSSENEKNTDVLQNDSKSTRRSRRLSDLDKKNSCRNSPVLTSTRDDLDVMCARTVSETDELLEDRKSGLTEQKMPSSSYSDEPSSSEHRLFTKSTSKCTKTVPPLRIKLKQPLKADSQNKCSSELKQKSSAFKNKSKHKQTKIKTKSSEGENEPSSIREEVNSDAPKQSSVSDKKGFTPTSKKKKITKQRKWSPQPTTSSPPSDTMTLRLNNERRLSAAGNLLSNPVLNKHACVLWSSENRRHMQLSNPKATLSELDAKLSQKWDCLSDKEKLKYFQRARDAIKDENRHSSRRHNTLKDENTRADTETKFSEESSVENFLKLPPVSQMSEIKKWLNFYNEVSPDACSEVISSFKEAILEENKKRTTKEADLEKSKTRSKKSKQKRKEERSDFTDSNSTYRKIIFEKILEKKENIIEILTEKKKAQHRSLLDSYCSMLRRMVSGDVVDFFGDVKSDKLTETLLDVKALEKDRRLAVTGDKYEETAYEDILARLSTRSSPDGKGLVYALEEVDVNNDLIENICQQIQSFPSLSPKTLDKHLPGCFQNMSEPVDGVLPSIPPGHSSRHSPITVLTDWVADDLIAYQPQIGFRRAISLLSNKIVPSPTIILPPKAINGSRSAANKNQNCNIVFTKLQRNRSSALAEIRPNNPK